jgi:hypothetical protein
MEDPAKLRELARWYREFRREPASDDLGLAATNRGPTRRGRRAHRMRAPHASGYDRRLGWNRVGVSTLIQKG